MKVSIIDKRTNRVVCVVPVTMRSVDGSQFSEDDYICEAWLAAVNDSVVDEKSMDYYTFSISY